MSTTLSAPAQSSPAVKNHRGHWSAALHGLPNLIVFTILGGLLYYGHHSGWKMPKLAALVGRTAEAEDDWCSEHLVPESQCIECKPELFARPQTFGFCRIHGVAECVIDHPELAQVKGTPQLPRYDTAQAIAVRDRPENNSRNTMHKKIVQFTSAESATSPSAEGKMATDSPAPKSSSRRCPCPRSSCRSRENPRPARFTEAKTTSFCSRSRPGGWPKS